MNGATPTTDGVGDPVAASTRSDKFEWLASACSIRFDRSRMLETRMRRANAPIEWIDGRSMGGREDARAMETDETREGSRSRRGGGSFGERDDDENR